MTRRRARVLALWLTGLVCAGVVIACGFPASDSGNPAPSTSAAPVSLDPLYTDVELKFPEGSCGEATLINFDDTDGQPTVTTGAFDLSVGSPWDVDFTGCAADEPRFQKPSLSEVAIAPLGTAAGTRQSCLKALIAVGGKTEGDVGPAVARTGYGVCVFTDGRHIVYLHIVTAPAAGSGGSYVAQATMWPGPN